MDLGISLPRGWLWPGYGMQELEDMLSSDLLRKLRTITHAGSQPQGTTGAFAEVQSTLATLVSQGIVVPRPSDVSNYLLRFPDLLALLSDVCLASLHKFRARAQVSLEVYDDLEVDDKSLTIYVRQNSYDEDIMDLIEDIWANYQEGLTGKSGWLLITTDFQSPR